MAEGRLRVELLGPLRAWLDDEELTLGPARQRAVFAVLAARAGHPVSRSEVIDAVWGESAPASAEGSVHTYISGLRRRMDPDRSRWSSGGVLVSESAGYLLKLEPEQLDLHVFDELQERAHRLRAVGEHLGAVESLDNALALWRGEAFSGVPGPFAELQRERLAEQRVLCLERRATSVLELGGHAELVAELAVLVQEHPLRESLWESLMIALYRNGRAAEALEGFQHVRNILIEELGIEPGPAIRRVHQQILTNDPALNAAARHRQAKLLSVVPAQVTRALQSDEQRGPFLGREAETRRLRTLVAEVAAGRGRSVWIEGEPGIGKSELLTVALADAGSQGCQVAWAVADELGQRFPLQVILECLGLEPPGDPRAQGAAGEADPVLAAVDQLLAHVDELCARAPLMLVIDDLQWADDASVLVWHRLSAATRQLPLLLVAASRPSANRVELAQLRRGVEARHDEVLMLTPLTIVDASELITEIVGAPPGPGLRALATRASGNPMYLREVMEALTREGALDIIDGTADIKDLALYEAPESLVAAVSGTLTFVSEATREALRWAALLGMEFAVAEVSAAIGKTPSELLDVFEEAVAATVLIEAGTQLAFRHPLLRHTLYEGIDAETRAVRHRRTAEALASIGVAAERVAEQLVAMPLESDDWVVEWLAEHHDTLATRAPLIAIELFVRVLETCENARHREVLLVALVRVLFRLDRQPVELARWALEIAVDPDRVAEMRHVLAAMLHSQGDVAAAVEVLKPNDDPETPKLWRQRRRWLLANFRRGDLTDLNEAVIGAREAFADALVSGELYPVGHSLQTLWLVSSIRRDHRTALYYIDRALTVLKNSGELADMRFDLLDNRMFSLQNLDRLPEAEGSLRMARELAAEYSLPHGLQVSAAVLHYWQGRWDEALVELDTVTEDGPAITFHGLREPGAAALLLHGVAALISGRRDNAIDAAAHLDVAEGHLPVTDAERESCDFLLVAQALVAEQRGDKLRAIEVQRPILDPDYAQMMLRHQWLPDLTRIAIDVGDLDTARNALAVCEEEAENEMVPARATAAAARCRALLADDPDAMLEVAEHYGRVGRRLEMASALEDAAVLLAKKDRLTEAKARFDAAVEEFAAVAASWDVRRAESRLREFGISRKPAAGGEGSSTGWGSLSPVEAEIAKLVAVGRSNPEIARELRLPRRTVQAHVARVLGKLGANSRVGIVDEVRARSASGGALTSAG
jgi:DNA-binding SARP family transcriptional activator/DNA-binding CsgD family transcriptional regulator/tetratricopeptide (TPR) repeat protein